VSVQKFMVVCVCLSSVLTGCRSEEVPVELGFPSETTFLFSVTGRLLAYSVDGGRAACTTATQSALAGDFGTTVFDSGALNVCEFREGGVSVPDIPDGPIAYVMLTYDRDGASVLLSGCTVVDLAAEAPEVRIDLSPTAYYGDTYAPLSPDCDVESRCGGTCQERN